MNSDGSGYRVADFIPFTPEIHNRLFERTHEAFWPWHFLLAGLYLLFAVLLIRKKGKEASLIPGVFCIWVGFYFCFHFYAELTWAGRIFGGMFMGQGLLLMVMGVTGTDQKDISFRPSFSQALGLFLLGGGLLLYPFIALLTGAGWAQSELAGLHPDPTAITSLGFILYVFSGWRFWLAAFLPLLWCVLNSQILRVLEEPRATGLLVVAAAGLLGGLCKTLSSFSDPG